jgi:hypothetical protein
VKPCADDPENQHVTGHQKQWQMHMNAAKEIIKARGGLETLQYNPFLSIVLFWYV